MFKETERRPEKIKALVAERAELLRRGVSDVLTRAGGFTVVCELSDLEAVGEAVADLAPDIAFVGLELADARGSGGGEALLGALEQALRRAPGVRLIVLMDGGSVSDLFQAVRAGARGVLRRDAPAHMLLEAAQEVLAGGCALDPRLTRSLFEHVTAQGTLRDSGWPAMELDPSVISALSPVERRVLRALALSRGNKEIAAGLGTTVGTVRQYVRSIYRKLGVYDRTAAVLVALRARLPDV